MANTENNEAPAPEFFIPTPEMENDLKIIRDILYGQFGTKAEQACIRRIAYRNRAKRTGLLSQRLATILVNNFGSLAESTLPK